MKPAVTLIEGRHITAHDKRNILACIEHIRENPGSMGTWLRRDRSRKSYAISTTTRQFKFNVLINERERDSAGRLGERTIRVMVEVKGIKPLVTPVANNLGIQLELFDE